MRVLGSRLSHTLLGLSLVLPTAGYAIPLADEPLFVEGSAKPNVMFAIDDSDAMDFEVVSEYYDPSTFEKVCNNPNANCREEEVVTPRYLFNSEAISASNPGGWQTNTGASGQVPFTPAFYYLRSSDYNIAYYNPESAYLPWPDTSTHTFDHSLPSSAKFEPTATGSRTMDLTDPAALDTAGNQYYPATYFEVVVDPLTVTNTKFNVSYTCDGPPGDASYSLDGESRTLYEDWVADPASTSLPDGVEAIAPDGGCLQRVELLSGSVQIQNFANWFTFYRRLHHATRGGIAESLSGLSGVRVGSFWAHNLRTVPMRNLDTDKELFLNENYERFGVSWDGAASTPLRSALQHAGQQFANNPDIIEAECQKNFTMLFAGGFNDTGITGVGNADGDRKSPYADQAFNTMADVAMYYYRQRLRSNDFPADGMKLPKGCYKQEGDPGFSSLTKTPVDASDPSYDPSVDCNPDLHMNTYAVALGPDGEQFVGKGYSSVSDVYETPPDWDLLGAVEDWAADQVDDLLHAAVNGRGEFYHAINVDQLREGLSEGIRDVIRSTGSATNVTFNTATLEEGSNVYTASFNSGDWSGSVAARALNPVTGAIANVVWDAAETILSKPASERFIVTNNDGGKLFNWDLLNVDQQDDLNGPDNDDLGPARLAYLRGDRSKEGSLFRKRSTVLGDVVNSSPVYVGQPASGWPDRDPFGVSSASETAVTTGRYSGFRQVYRERTPMVYAGANDGMLHGFDAQTGEELLAYVPGFAYSSDPGRGLSFLTDRDYQHRYYVDLSPAVSDIYIDGEWQTILLGGMRTGGSGIFALDITDPADFDGSSEAAANAVMWEFTDPDLGVITEPPLVSLVNWGNKGYRWSALVPNGYNSTNGKTGLFVLDIQAGLDGWDIGDYQFVELDTSGQGLSPLRAVDFQDLNGDAVKDGIVDRVYAGDLDGNLWAVDLSVGPNSWGSVYKSGGTPAPFFVAQNNSGQQPITTAPVIGRNVYYTSGSAPNLLVFFGTGSYITSGDPTSNAIQSFYGVWDAGSTVTRSELEPRDIATSVESGLDVRRVSGNSIDWESSQGKKGWVLDFDEASESGERVIESPLVRGEYVLFNTVTPTESLCQSGGTSWTMALNFDGTTPLVAVFDVNNDGQVSADDAIIGGVKYGDSMILNSNILGDNLYRQASDGEIDQLKVDLGGGVKTKGRSGWREIYEE